MRDYIKQNKATWINGMCVFDEDLPKFKEKQREYEKTHLLSSREIPQPKLEQKRTLDFGLAEEKQDVILHDKKRWIQSGYINRQAKDDLDRHISMHASMLDAEMKQKAKEILKSLQLETNQTCDSCGDCVPKESSEYPCDNVRYTKWRINNMERNIDGYCGVRPEADNCPGWKPKTER